MMLGLKAYLSKFVNRWGRVVRVVVAGDTGTGKTSLVLAAGAYDVQKYFVFDFDPMTIIDTSSRIEDTDRVNEELQRADSIILTHACDRPETLENLTTCWIPRLRKLQVKAPVVVVGCKLDIEEDKHQELVSLEHVISPLLKQFYEIQSYIECSAYRSDEVIHVFFLAQMAALYPLPPLYDQHSKTLMPRCARALKRIFTLYDSDKDGILTDAELNALQVKCFNDPLDIFDICRIKKVVQNNVRDGVNDQGLLTLSGFLFINTYFIEKGPIEAIWTMLRKFGYDNDIKLTDDFIPPLKRAPDQSVELTKEAIDFLEKIFDEFDGDSDKVLQPPELEELFSSAPKIPWIENPYKDAVERNAFGGLSLDAFLSEWELMTLLNPTFSLENLIYIGYPGDPTSAIRVTRRRHIDRKKQHSERNVVQCFIFGPMKAGKSALLNSFIGRPYSEAYYPTNEDRYAVNVVDISREKRKFLVLREISEGGVTKLLANKESLASCDIAVFVHDRSDESSWKASSELLLKIAGHGKETGFQVPCLIVAAKDDQDSFTMAVQDTMVSQEMGVEEALVPTSVKLGDLNNIFCRIVTAAIPKTEAGKTRKRYHRLIDQSLMLVSVGLGAAVVVGVGAARKNVSS